jgi:lysine 2,3-aminomutase
VVDAPHGGGKIPVLPTYVVTQSPTHTVLRNYEGMLIAYPEPQQRFDDKCTAPREESAPGVWELTAGQYSRIQPRETLRHARRQPCCTSDESVGDF